MNITIGILLSSNFHIKIGKISKNKNKLNLNSSLFINCYKLRNIDFLSIKQ